MTRKISILLLLLILLFLGVSLSLFRFTGGSWDIPSSLKIHAISKEQESLHREINNLIDVRATDETRCRTIAFGHALCGGPAIYLVYSIEHTDEERLRSLIEKYNDLSEERDNLLSRRDGVSGTCSIVMPPELRFDAVRGECKALY